ncbi:hypothetical protein TL16_g09876 [Triparma laevis f. inornata]|uniref:tRNA/rRNA methyltransferase SpoU type domain-containing protein n=1 Tax=Triparma laevis f. inornata TaxID=1714386 RepID=A0A9W7BCX6_9STRA|nr:hypothetical protein TL16_g09876 [Triparma laevis f. inornata]
MPSDSPSDSPFPIISSPLSVWRGLLKNVPGSLTSQFPSYLSTKDGENDRAAHIASLYVILVSTPSNSPGPILVLQGLRYKGNIGAIIRTAVQANIFESIVIIDPIFEEDAKNNSRVEEKDVDYYSLMNAPLIEIVYMKDLHDFKVFSDSEMNKNRKWLATHLNSEAINMFSPLASSHLLAASIDSFVFLGSEGDGLPEGFVEDERCTCLRIPSMSSSINVGAAAAMVVACICMHRR